MTADGNAAPAGKGATLALGALLALVLCCCVAGGIAAVLREEEAGGTAPRDAQPSGPPQVEAASVDGPIHYTLVRRSAEARPARFDAALPSGPHAFREGWTAAHPPLGHVADALCRGDRVMADRWLTAASGGPESAATSHDYVAVMQGCEHPALCAWAAETLGSTRPARELRALWTLAAQCDGDAMDALFRERPVPPEAYVEWAGRQAHWGDGAAFERGEMPPRVDVEKLAAAVEALAAEGRAVRPFLYPRAPAMILGATDDPRAAAVLLRLHAAEHDDAARHALAMAMHAQRDRRARQIFELDCQTWSPPAGICSASTASSPAALAAREAALVPVAPAVFSRLRTLGLLGTPKPDGPVAQSAIELLVQSGRAAQLAVDEVEVDWLVREFAALATPILDDVVFDATDPSAATGGDQRSLLVAWSRGERFEAELDPYGDTGNVEIAVGLLNVLARARGSNVRFVFYEDDEVADVVVGREPSLRAAIAEGLIDVWLPPAAASNTAGDAFLRALRGEPDP
jgi:hypothetical protein